MSQLIDVVKRSGSRPTESFDAEKLRGSIYAACLSVRTPEGVAESTAKNVTKAVVIWLSTKPTITSHDIRHVASTHLHRYHPEAAYLYKHHKVII